MRKLTIIFVTAALLLTGCSNTDDSGLGDNGIHSVPNRFGVIESHTEGEMTWYVLYDKKTGVEYFFIDAYQQQALSPIYDSDGDVMIYAEVR